MNKPSTTSSEAIKLEAADQESVIASLDDPQAVAHEPILELTEIVKDDEQEVSTEVPITVDCPEERYRELKEEVSRIGGEIEEHKIVEDHTLAKVDISNERYVIICALKGVEAKESIADIREGVHLALKGQEAGFHVLGGDWMNHVQPFVVEMAYPTIKKVDQFFGLSNDLERHASKDKKLKVK